MRTDSNTVLSLTPSVPPKKSTLVKASENGAAFASDFNKAKETQSPKKSPTTNASSASDTSVSTSSSTDSTSKALDKNAAPAIVENKENAESKGAAMASESSNSAVESTVSAEKSGKALQQDGEDLPAKGSSAVAVEEGAALTSVALSPELSSELQEAELKSSSSLYQDGSIKDAELKSSSSLQLDASAQETGLKSSSSLQLDASAQEAGLKSSPSLQLDTNTQEAAISSTGQKQIVNNPDAPEESNRALATGAGVLGLGAIKQAASGHLSKTDSPENLVALADSGKSVIDPSGIDSSYVEGDGELSWVLSQMDASGAAKAVPVNPMGDVALDTAKAASASMAAGSMAAGVLGATSKDGRSGAVPSALLGAGVASTFVSDEASSDSTDALLGEDGILINEPIELRKKEQEAMIGRMSAQIDGAAADNASGGLNSSLHNNNVNRTALGVAAAGVAAQNPPPNLAMSVPPGHPGWAGEMSQKIAWVARDGGHTAHIRLDPPELGSLTVKVSVDSDSNTQVSFVAATPQARDLLEGQMGRLREMLAQQGMDLSRADVDVSQQDTSGAQGQGNDRNNGSNQGKVAGSDVVDDELIQNNLSYVSATGVDYYA